MPTEASCKDREGTVRQPNRSTPSRSLLPPGPIQQLAEPLTAVPFVLNRSASSSPGARQQGRSVTPGTGVALRVASNLRNPSRADDPDEQRAADRR